MWDALEPDLVVLATCACRLITPSKLPRGFTSPCPNTPVVVYTMFGDVVGEHLAKILGIAAMVPKSDGVGKLLGRIKALLEAEDALSMQGH